MLGGYNYLLPYNFALTPIMGLRYAQYENGKYRESNASLQNLSVRKNSYTKLEGILGLKAATHYYIHDTIIKPEIHGFINYDFHGKLPAIDARIEGLNQPLMTARFKDPKISYNLGAGILAKYDRF